MRAGLLGSNGEKSGSPSAQMNDQSNGENLAKGAGVSSPFIRPHHRDLQWMCAACGWIHYPVAKAVAKPTPLSRWEYVAPDECDNCQHRAIFHSWIHVQWLDWYSTWEVIA